MLLCQGTESKNKTRQDYDRRGLRIPPVEKLRYKCRSFRYAVTQLSGTDYHVAMCIETFKSRLKTFYFNKWLAEQV